MYENGLSPADLRAVIGGNCNNGGSFLGGGNFFEAIIALAVLAMFTGNGNGGIFGGGNNNSCREAVDQQTLIGKLDGITNGISDSTYALTGAITGGFHAAEVSACQQQAAIMAQLCAMAADSAKCCCETQRGIERGFAEVNYNLATQACDTRNLIQNVARDITDNANANTRAILDFMVQDKIATLTAENQSLKFAASQAAQNAFITANQEAQTATLLRRLGADCPTPAYLVNAPTPVSFPVNSCGQVQFGGGCGGCGYSA
jgi:hypothetical protein